MAYKGSFRPKNPEKYIGKVDRIVFRSGWELKLMKFLDSSSTVLKWSSEEVIIPYRSPIDNEIHRYFCDFYVERVSTSGELQKKLIEVKPKAQTKLPVKKGRNTRKYVNELKTYAVNQAKWIAADAYAKKRGWVFEKMTEDELKINQRNRKKK